MKKRKSSINKLKLNKIGFQSSTSIYKEKFSVEEITFKPKFSITKKASISRVKKMKCPHHLLDSRTRDGGP